MLSLRNEGIFTPPDLGGTIVVPSNVGGAHWGGLTYDSNRGIAVVAINRLVAMVQLIPVDQMDTAQARQNASRLGDEYTRMHGTPYVMRRKIVTAESGLPCSPPPWGTVAAIDLKNGKLKWESPLGDPGMPGLGGPIVTASGLVFIGASMDHFIRAYDIDTGRELWKGALPAGARATPMTYMMNGKQFVVIAAGGNEDWGKADSVIAFALPKQ
jgi:quinoprotein glucose dehydrogenase